MLQFGTDEQRRSVVGELKGDISELARLQYGHFIVLGMLRYCRDEGSQKVVFKALRGNMDKLAVNSISARVVEVALQELPNKEATLLKREFYGKQYSLFADEVPAQSTHASSDVLASVIKENPDSRDSILETARSMIEKVNEKKLLVFGYVQEVIGSYSRAANGSDVRSLASLLADETLDIIASRPGAIAAAQMAAYATAKDRKRMMKVLKGFSRSTLLHRDAYLSVIRLCQVTDDTVNTQKMILAELLKAEDPESENSAHPLSEIAAGPNSSKLLLWILSDGPGVPEQYFDPWELELLGSAEIDGEQTSKKNDETRKAELRQYMKSEMVRMVKGGVKDLLENKAGCKVLLEIFKKFEDETAGTDESVKDCILSHLDANPETFEHPQAHYALKWLFKHYSSGNGKGTFPADFVSKWEDKYEAIISSPRGAFVLVALAECGGDAVKSLKSKGIKDQAKAKMKDAKSKGGYEALIKSLTN